MTSRSRRTSLPFSAEIDLHLERERDLTLIIVLCHVGPPVLCLFHIGVICRS